MKEVIVHPSPELHTTIHDVPIPEPGPDEIVIKVIVAGSNVKDWLHITAQNISMNSGDDIAGIIYSIGNKVSATHEFAPGDRVAAFHPMLQPHGAYAEYAVAPMHTTFKLPDEISFEEAATLPLVLTTAALSLYCRQHLPPPWSPRSSNSPPIPLIIYGASSSLGTFAIKLARASNIHPIIAIAGFSASHLAPLLDTSKGDALIDYRPGIEAMKVAVKEALKGLECRHALDAISSKGTWIPVSQMLPPSSATATSYLSVVAGSNKYDEEEIQEGVEIVYTMVGSVHTGKYKPTMPKQPNAEEVRNDPEWAYLFFRYFGRMVSDGRLTAHPFEVVEGGLEGVENGLKMLKDGKARWVKFVYRPSPRLLFIYGTLLAKPLLAWALTGDASQTDVVSDLMFPAKVDGYARFSVHNCDYPAVVKHDASSSVSGCLLMLKTTSQRRKLDDFEGEAYLATPVSVTLLEGNEGHNTTVDADMYVWNGEMNAVSSDPWDLDTFVKERLEDWIELFAGMELVGEEDEVTLGGE
ncbi:hypothetical protein B7463_g2579, partial [Scytalidium lignicola]